MTPDADPTGAVPARRGYQRPLPVPTGRVSSAEPVPDALVIDCDSCSMRGIGCGDCMVTVLLGGPPFGVALDETERRAIDALAGAGLIPPLRMAQSVDPPRMLDDGEP